MKKSTLILFGIMALQSHLYGQSWVAMANIPVTLTFPVVVSLSGEIHMIGGGAASGATDIHIRYTPVTNTWDTLAPVPYLAQQPAGAVLNGKIHYFGGGYPNSGTPLDKHFVFDPTSNTWDSAAFLPQPRVIMEAAALNGKLYAIGGQPDKTLFQEYDPASDTWTTKNPLPDQNFWYSTIAINNGEMYRFGGGGYVSPVDFIHQYNAVNDSWNLIGAIPATVHAIAGASINNQVILSGGYHSVSLDSTWLFNVSNQNIISGAQLPVARSYHEMVTIDSCVYSVGGDNISVPAVKTSLLRYCPGANVAIQSIADSEIFKVIQNPYSVQIKILNENDFSKTAVELIDVMGRKIFLKNAIESGAALFEFNTSHLINSVYFVRINIDNQFYTFKIPVTN